MNAMNLLVPPAAAAALAPVAAAALAPGVAAPTDPAAPALSRWSSGLRRDTVERILDAARWAPRGDNSQPWRFETTAQGGVVVHGFDTRTHCVYDRDGRASQLSLGTLLQTIEIAASGHGLRAVWRRREDAPEQQPTFDIRFFADPGAPSPLIDSIEQRRVQRRPLSTRPLDAVEIAALEAAVGPGYRIQWLHSPVQRLRAALLMFSNAKLRLTMPEAYPTHRDIIEWDARFSADRVPDQALGVDAATRKLMRFVLGSWGRVRFFNRFLAGTWGPRLQMDLLPGWACAAHLVLKAEQTPRSIDDHVDAGRAVQRLWLTATRLGLQKQPQMTPLIFARYLREGTPFTAERGLQREAVALAGRLGRLLGADTNQAVWMARIGAGPAASARSLRRPLAQLMAADR